MVCWAIKNSLGGELFVPKIPSYKITDLAEAIAPSCKKHIVGIRPGEKIHEEMITISDGFNTIDLGKYYAILPSDGKLKTNYQQQKISFESVRNGFSYNSGTNSKFLDVQELRDLIKTNLKIDFVPL